MRDIESEIEQQADQLRETAAEMPKHFFMGKELEPFSIGRQLACERILGRSMAKERETAMVIIFACTVAPDELEKTRTPDGVKAFRQAMYKWAEEEKITVQNHAGKEMIRIADLIWDELDASDFKPAPKADQKSKDPGPPNESGPVPSRPTLRQSRASRTAPSRRGK